MIKKGFLLASFAIGVFANIFAQDTLSFKKTRDKNIYIEFLGASNLIGVSFDSRFTPISPWGYRIGISYFQGGDSFIEFILHFYQPPICGSRRKQGTRLKLQ